MGKRKAPCWFCEMEHIDQSDENGIQLNVEVYPDNQLMGIIASGVNEAGNFNEAKIDVEMNYCPVCGRKCGY